MAAPTFTRKAFASSILLWMREGVPRQQSMDRWKGPHSLIITASPGQDEYRQPHLAEKSPGLGRRREASRPRSPRIARSTAWPR